MINLEFRLVVVAVALAHTGILLHVDQETSHKLIDEISLGDLIRKPGSECPFIPLRLPPKLSLFVTALSTSRKPQKLGFRLRI
jgi:hypothetical protein